MRTRSLRKSNVVFTVATVLVLTTLALLLGGPPTPGQATAPFGGAIVMVNQVTQGSQDEPTITINPTNPRNLVAGSITAETGTGQCAAYASTDRGRTWTHQILPNAATFPAAGRLCPGARDLLRLYVPALRSG